MISRLAVTSGRTVCFRYPETAFDVDEVARIICLSGEEESVLYMVVKDLYAVYHHALP